MEQKEMEIIQAYRDWLQLPHTQSLVKSLEDYLQNIKDAWSSGNFSEAKEIERNVGKCLILNEIINQMKEGVNVSKQAE